MLRAFESTELVHIPYQRHSGTAKEDIITRESFASAIAEITAWDGYAATPLHHLKALATKLNLGDILYKDEGPRFGLGSFKALGGAYAAAKVLQHELSRKIGNQVDLADIRNGRYVSLAKEITLVSATDGNHGRSLAWGAQRFGAACNIYIHEAVSEGRAEAMRHLGANVIRIDGDYDASVHLARKEAEINGWFVVSDTSWEGYRDPPLDVMAGYGVMTDEIAQQMESPPTHVFLQGGVGGLAASVCSALRQHWGQVAPRVIIVEPNHAACLFESAQSDEMKSVHIFEETIMAGLSCGEPSPIAWEILREETSDFIKISDDIVAPAMRLLAKPLGNDPSIEGGESAVAGLAAALVIAINPKLRNYFDFDETSKILLIGSESATDRALYEQVMTQN
ncbi:diaminopropionate ammonia-lyase [Kiloniella antarctica]|uniref:Diaminopropionate ammonia-lyase n=1 Tax=Kiloniella antarctica TaxID=1550907 RepID=A0ABW5BFU3_9PROT